MPKICIYALFFVVLTACGPARDLKKAQKLLARAVEKGATVDTVTLLKHDTLRFSAFRDLISTTLIVNPTFVTKACQEIQKARTQGQKDKAVENLQRELCPPVSLDTTYQMKLQAQGKDYSLPIHVVINTKGGFHYLIESGVLEVPIVREENKIAISAGRTEFQYWKGVISGLLLGLVIGAILAKMFLK